MLRVDEWPLVFGATVEHVGVILEAELGLVVRIGDPGHCQPSHQLVWNGLTAYLFGDEFLGWCYTGTPRLTTLEGVTLGSTVAELSTLDPDMDVSLTT